MLKIGCHLSTAKGFLAMGKDALEIGANTFQFFTRNPRGGKAKELDLNDVAAYLEFAKENGIGVILAHAPYTLNTCSAEAKTREFALMAMADDLVRLEHLPGNYYNFHPGSHVGQGEELGIGLIQDALNQVLRQEQKTIVLLETMAGKGSEVGKSFEELRKILDGVKQIDKMGVCLDTCHVHDAGYNLVNGLDGVLMEFDKIIGLEKLKAVHLNDSMNPLGSRKDRHEKIGKGCIGINTFEAVINHPKLKDLPFYLETPNELPGHAEEIALLKSLYQENK